MAFNWQLEDWPHFRYNLFSLEKNLYQITQKIGVVTGILTTMSDESQLSTMIDNMVTEAIKTSEIEGEFLSREDVLSSIRNNLGVHDKQEKVNDKRARGVGDLMTVVRKSFAEPLSITSLLSWHQMLMAFETKVNSGQWRKSSEPMQVVSGAYGRTKVHFEAPPSAIVPAEMERFIEWFNLTGPDGSAPIIQAPIRSAIAHLYFETIHPFEDGNGRIGRAIAEKALSQGTGQPVLLSLSRAIQAKRNAYYEALKEAQRSNEITPWLNYFVDLVLTAQSDTEREIDFSLRKTKFFDRFGGQLSERQLKAINRMLEEGPEGFKGGMNARKYIAITHSSKATATRDLQQLLEMQAFNVGPEGGRSTYYTLSL